ncbi:MAG: MFS transporter [bacterium]|jgi:hypothetical protein
MMTAASHSPLPRPALYLILSRGVGGLGATLTAFGLDVWVFQKTGSYAIFASLALLATLPSLLFAPLAGVIADRYDKRRVLLACDLVSLLSVLTALAFHQFERLTVPIVALTIVGLSISSSVRWTVMGPIVTLSVPREQLSRANGLLQTFQGATAIFGPILAAGGLSVLGLGLLLGLNVLTYVFVVGVLAALWLRLPLPQRNKAERTFHSFAEEITFGFRWVWRNEGLRRLLVFFMLLNIGLSIMVAAMAPYVLSFSSGSVLGIALGAQGTGAMLMGAIIARRGIPPGREEAAVLWGATTFGIFMVAWGISRDAITLSAVAFAFGALTSIVMASSQTIWQSHVPAEVQGKVFAVRMMTSFGLTPLAILVSIPLSVSVFGPLLSTSQILQSVWGSGQTGTLGLMVSVLGLAIVTGGVGVWAGGGIRVARAAAVR